MCYVNQIGFERRTLDSMVIPTYDSDVRDAVGVAYDQTVIEARFHLRRGSLQGNRQTNYDNTLIGRLN